MKFKINTIQYWSLGILLSIVFSYWASLRGYDDADTEVYLLFYQRLIEDGIVGIQSCQSFEPLFCGTSFIVGNIFGSNVLVQYFWVFIYFLTSFKAFTIFYNIIHFDYKFKFDAALYFAFISINYVDPQIVFFLTRQYVAASFLMLGFAMVASKRNPLLSFGAAILMHFGSFPIALIAYLASRNLKFKRNELIMFAVLIIIILYFLDAYFIEVYFESMKYKIEEYADKNDGDVTFIQEFKLFIYLGLSVWLFLRTHTKLVLATTLIYLFYLFTGFNDLIHLRYYKYLESISWPGVFMFVYFFKENAPFIIAGALSFRIYKYLTLISPESSLPFLGEFYVNNIISFFVVFLNYINKFYIII